MNTYSKNILLTKKYVILLAVVLVVGCYGVINLVLETRLQSLEDQLVTDILEQEEVLATIAETTSRNTNDEATADIVSDCNVTERVKFDDLLGQLDRGLPRADLIELDRLFGRCGAFYAKQKAVMVFRLNREVEAYEAYVNQLGIVQGIMDTYETKLTGWRALVIEEEKQSKLFAELVTLQEEIISNLLAGKSASSEEMVTILREVREIQDTLVVANKQASNLRATLISQ